MAIWPATADELTQLQQALGCLSLPWPQDLILLPAFFFFFFLLLLLSMRRSVSECGSIGH